MLGDKPLQLLSRLPAHSLDILARPPWTHSPHVVWSELYVHRPYVAVSRDNHGPAALSAQQPRSRRYRRVYRSRRCSCRVMHLLLGGGVGRAVAVR